ncbi:AT-hook motif nuclear-localized protein 18-like [Vicia villosa]|uniref:AT-hook motif nuclear-localized protein 18-like n=1 Tax=Vicia villosa TaxID=3911 RepID=UPI00273CCC5A|nr:AT-hook motif nuclear-localized protein 18-like [Vicia villosa]
MSTKREITCVRDGERMPEFHLSLRPLLKKQTRVLAAGRRLRGRPIGSKNKPKILGVLTGDNRNTFKFHTIKINDGVDIMKRLFDFSKRQKRAISIITGNGVVEKARFLQSNGGITTLHGTFNILSISGIILPAPKLESEAKLAISLL